MSIVVLVVLVLLSIWSPRIRVFLGWLMLMILAACYIVPIWLLYLLLNKPPPKYVYLRRWR